MDAMRGSDGHPAWVTAHNVCGHRHQDPVQVRAANDFLAKVGLSWFTARTSLHYLAAFAHDVLRYRRDNIDFACGKDGEIHERPAIDPEHVHPARPQRRLSVRSHDDTLRIEPLQVKQPDVVLVSSLVVGSGVEVHQVSHLRAAADVRHDLDSQPLARGLRVREIWRDARKSVVWPREFLVDRAHTPWRIFQADTDAAAIRTIVLAAADRPAHRFVRTSQRPEPTIRRRFKRIQIVRVAAIAMRDCASLPVVHLGATTGKDHQPMARPVGLAAGIGHRVTRRSPERDPALRVLAERVGPKSEVYGIAPGVITAKAVARTANLRRKHHRHAIRIER